MKAKDVPQDNANMFQGKLREPIYSLDKDGNYTTVPSVGWAPKNAVMQEAWDNVNEKIEQTKQDVIAGKLSPIAYYIEKNIMDVGLLASYMHMRKWTIKRHLKPKNFAKLSDDVLEQYATVFTINKEELTDIEILKKIDN